MSTPQQASTTSSPETSQSIITRLVLTPLLFISFIISLFLVDKSTYSKVLNGHGSEDYWYHSHQKKMAKREIEEAFQLRNKVLAAIFVISGLTMAVVGWGGREVLWWLFPGLKSEAM